MPRIFYKGKLSPFLKFVIICNNFLAWINGNSGDKGAVRKRIQEGYEGLFSRDVERYDEFSLDHYTELADKLLHNIDCKDKLVLDLGCGTGILTQRLLEKGASKVVSLDFSNQMIGECRKKFVKLGYWQDRIEYKQADAERLPFRDNTFDLVVSGMMLGMGVDQKKILSEMHRVIKPGGDISISTHGPEWYCEIVETLTICLLKNYPIKLLGSAVGTESWFFPEKRFFKMLKKEGFKKASIINHKGSMKFKNGGEVWDFFAACSSAWFLELFDPKDREAVIKTIRDYFLKKNVTRVTYEALMGYGQKI